MSGDDFELTGAIAPPLQNGELAFDAPWQSRVFGIARSLAEQGLYSWDDFRGRLISAIARWEQQSRPGAEFAYYDCFLGALEELLVERGLLADGELRARAGHFGQRPHGHDHHHGHYEHR